MPAFHLNPNATEFIPGSLGLVACPVDDGFDHPGEFWKYKVSCCAFIWGGSFLLVFAGMCVLYKNLLEWSLWKVTSYLEVFRRALSVREARLCTCEDGVVLLRVVWRTNNALILVLVTTSGGCRMNDRLTFPCKSWHARSRYSWLSERNNSRVGTRWENHPP